MKPVWVWKLLFPFFLLGSISCAYAQRQRIEEYKLKVREREKNPNYRFDSIYIQRRNMVAYYYWNVVPDSSIVLGKENLELANRINYTLGQLDALNATGIGYWSKGEYYEAMDYFQKALAIAQKTGSKKGIGDVYNNIAMIQSIQGNYAEAIDSYYHALRMFDALNDQRAVATAYSNIALFYFNQNRIEEAQELHLKVLKIHENMDNKTGIAIALGNLSNTYMRQGKYEEAEKLLMRALDIRQQTDDQKGFAHTYNQLGDVWARKKDLVKAGEYYQKALQISEKLGDKRGILLALNNIASIEMENKNWQKSLDMVNKTLEIALKMKAKDALQGCYEDLSKIQTAMGAHEKALESYKIARKYTDSLKNIKVERETTQKIAKYEYEKKEAKLRQLQTEERLAYLHREAELKAQQIEQRLENDKQQALLQAEHEKKEGILKAEQAQQKAEFAHKESIAKAEELKRTASYEQTALRQRWIIILILAISFFITALTVVVLRNRNQIKKAYTELTSAHGEIKQQQEEILSQAEELKTLNQQLIDLDKFKQNLTGMIVHDLKNPVNALLNLSFERNPDYPQQIKSYAQQMQILILNMLDVQKFEEARMVLDKNRISLNEVAAEAHRQVDYLAKQKNIVIERYFEANIYVEIDIDLVCRVMVNLLTNAVKYSPMNSPIQFNLTTENQTVRIAVKDQGMGISPEKQALVFQKFVQLEAKKMGDMRSTGLGLTFCKMVVEEHRGKIGIISNHGEGAEFWFTLEVVGQEALAVEMTPNLPTAQKMLSDEDKQTLLPYLPTLRDLQVYYNTALEEELSKISFHSETLKDWEMRLQNAIFAMNQDLYEQILGEAS